LAICQLVSLATVNAVSPATAAIGNQSACCSAATVASDSAAMSAVVAFW